MPFDESGKWEKPKRPTLNHLELKEAEPGKPQLMVDFPDDWRGVTSFDYAPFAKQAKRTVDIVVPIYRAATQLKACIESVFKHTNREFQLYLVDDCSNDSAIEELLKSVEDVPNVTVLRQDMNRGFAATVNVGCRAGDGDWVVILNSDTLVTPNWLTKCIAAGEADERNAVVNPVTNNTALIKVPMLPGCSYYDMNRLMEQTSTQAYPEIMPTGFCFIIRRDVLQRLGFLDEGFHSYGEETDLWMRVLKGLDHGVQKGLRAVLADDTYIFHERGTSFSALGQDSHMSLRQKGNERFHQRNPDYQMWADTINTAWITRLRDQIPPDQKGSPNLVWLVADASQCGGMDLIADYVNALIEEGWNAKVAIVRRDAADDSDPIVIPHLRTQPIVLRYEHDLLDFPIKEGTVVAATTELLAAAYKIKAEHPNLKVLHHIQSNDLDLAPKESKKDMLTLLKSNLTDYHMSASQWAGDALLEAGGKKGPIPVVLPGVDTLLFHPRERSGDPRPTVLIHTNRNYPFKGYDRAVEIAHRLVQKDVRVLAVGEVSVPEVPQVVAVGKVSKTRMAQLLSEVDLVVDPSYNHSYGMPQAEALASGVPFVCWDNKGCWEFGEVSAAMVINNESATDYEGIVAFIEERTLESNVQLRVSQPPSHLPGHGSHSRDNTVELFLRQLSDVLGTGTTSPKKIVLVTPHVRKHGGPTTIIDMANGLKGRGHTVLLTSVYGDYNPEVVRTADVPINFDWGSGIETDLLICHGDSDKFEFFEKYPAKKKIMLKLSHNPRFMALEKQGLGIEWDHIMTSTEWLRDLCVDETNGVKMWPNEDVTRVGWRHYTHDIFDKFNDRSYGSINTGLNVGTLFHNHPTKGTDDALNALKAIQIEGYSNVGFTLIGEVRGVQVRKPYHYFCKPNRRLMATVMGQIDIWVVASHSEGLGRLALEAASAGAALVCTDTGSEFLVDEENCLLVPVKDVEAIHVAVERLMKDDGLRAKLRLNAYQTAKEKADPKPYLDVVEGVIRKVFDE